MSLYALTNDGVIGFLARRVGMSRFMRRQPLAGLVDATNLIFLMPQYPCLQSVSIYSGATLVNSNQYVFYGDTGTVQFYSAPSAQPVADYTAIQLTNQQIIYYLWAGFSLMEALWSRKYLLSSNANAYAMASPTSTDIYLCQGPLATGAVPADPVIGTMTFSTSPIQRSWLERCAEFAYLDSMSIESALSDVDISERVGGVRISTSHRSPNIRNAKESVWNEMLSQMYAALDEFDSTGAHYGKVADQVHSQYYEEVWQWQNDNGILTPTGLNQWW